MRSYILYIANLFFLIPLSFAKSEKAPIKIVVLGDSVTAGYGVSQSKAFPALLEEKLNTAKGKKYLITNAGISGSTSASGHGRLKWLLKSNPEILILELGANDGLRGQSPEATKSNLIKTIQLAKKSNLKVFLTAMVLPPNYGEDYRTKFKKVFEQIALEEKVTLIPFAFDKMVVQSKTKLTLPDGLHPNEEGHLKIADELAKFLKDKI